MTDARRQLGLANFWAGARAIAPGTSVREWLRRVRFVVACLRVKPMLNAFFGRAENALLYDDVVQRPELLGFVVWPYLHAGWSVMERFEALSQHRVAVATDMKSMAMGPLESREIADLSAIHPGLRLVMDRASWCLREGGLVFNQFLNDERMMSLAFSFGMLNGERVAYVGSVQGSNIDSALEKYRDIAKGLQGMRSRDFLIKAFQQLTFHLGVKRVLCVSEEQRHHRHPYFGTGKSEKLHLNYDEIWLEHSGVAQGDGFFQLASLPVVRPMEDIASKNRPLYRRRYALMDKLSADIASRYAPGAAPPSPDRPS